MKSSVSMKKPFSWLNPKLQLRITKQKGKGLYATEDIRKGSLLCIFGGYIMTRVEEEQLPEAIRDYGMQISEEFIIGIRSESETVDGTFFNHSCNPNAGFKGQIFLVAMKNIRGGEEVTFDYGMVLSKIKGAKPYKMKCLCGEKNCRTYVSDNDWKLSILQKRYEEYFQWYLEEKIKRYRNKSEKIHFDEKGG